jgi:hypothetical protein
MENNGLITINKTTLDALLTEFDELESVQAQRHALEMFGQYISECGRIREWSKLFEARILYELKKRWTSGAIRPEITSQYEDFYDWAMRQEYVKIRSQSKSGIRNKINVWKCWKSEEATIQAPPTVFLPSGEFDEYNEEILNEAPFNADHNYTKLLRATGAGNDGDLNDECWAAIVDPFQTVEDLGEAIKASRNGVYSTPKPPKDDKIVSFGGCLRIVSNGNYTPFAQWTNVDDPTAGRGRAAVLAMLGLKDEPFEIDVDYSAGIEFDGDGATLNLSSGQTVQLSEDEEENIFQQLLNRREKNNEH